MHAQLTFLHAADLHLGAPFRGLRALSQEWAERLLDAIPEAYDRVIQTALLHHVDFVVFSGDIFDTARPSYADYAHFFEGLSKLSAAHIPVYVCTGNHDPYTSWRQDFGTLPEGAYMFEAQKPSYALYERDGDPLCILAGRSYYNQTWPVDVPITEGLTRPDAERALGPRAEYAPFCVGVMHSGLDVDVRNAPTDPAVLFRSGMTYWALGHLHNKQLTPPENPRYGFPGCIQGRDIAETGERGVYIVTLSTNAPNEVRFVPTASVVWQRMTVDISDCANLNEVTDKIIRELFLVNGKAHCEEMCVRITLTGSTPLHDVLLRPGVVEDVRKTINTAYAEFFCDALIDGTTAPIDREAMRAEGLFPAVFLQASDAMRAHPDDVVSYLQDEFIKRDVPFSQPKSRDVDAVVSAAENLVLDLLAKEDDR